MVFEPNDDALWAKIRRTISAFLVNEWRKGALFGLTPDEAFYVKCDGETNPAEGIDAGQVVCEIGVAPVKPAEFVIFRLSQFSGGTSLVSRVDPPPNRPRKEADHGTARSRQRRSATPSAWRSTASRSSSITEVTGLKMEQDVIELKQNGARRQVHDQEAAGPAGRRARSR